MNPNYTDFKFPQIKAHPWAKVFSKRMPADAVDLVSKLLQYSPTERYAALPAMTHPFFDELRDPSTQLPSGRLAAPVASPCAELRAGTVGAVRSVPLMLFFKTAATCNMIAQNHSSDSIRLALMTKLLLGGPSQVSPGGDVLIRCWVKASSLGL